MVIYDCNTVGKLWVSPYTQIQEEEKGLLMRQSVFRTELCLEADLMWCRGLCKLLGGGATMQELQAYLQTLLSESDAQELTRILIRKGMIE